MLNYDSLRKIEEKEKLKRITIDLDSRNIFKRLWCIFILKLFGYKDMEIKPSPSKKGYHVIAWHDKGYSFKFSLFIRRLAGDDKIRINLDKRTGRQVQVLFDKKKVEVIK